jgi:DNA invertase Pin-like site-specific DNA recombinase
MKTAAIYARVSSDKQKEENTIASQTAALVAFARSRGYDVPDEWIFEDEGYSGANLVRPGLERVRDLAAEGLLHAILVHSPDRLSRKYAYQVLLIEEFSRHGVETVFQQSPQTATAEDRLLLQLQGMMAEYERAQILERCRRGKRHRARQGQVSVLSGAPYGYHYVRKSEQAAAYYEIIRGGGGRRAQGVRMLHDPLDEHRRNHAPAQWARDSNAQAVLALGTVHGLGDAPQPDLQGSCVLRQDACCTTAAYHATLASAWRHRRARQCKSRATARGLDRDSRTRHRQR